MCFSVYSCVQFFHIWTSKSGPNMQCFVHFDFKMCFSLQRRAILPHRNFKKWSETVSFLTFWLWNVPRHSCVQFFHIATSKSGPPMRCFVHFDLKMCFSLQRRAIFPHLNFKKWSETVSFLRFWLENALLATAACNFSTSLLQKVLRDRQFFTILTSKCASRYSGVQFFMSPLNSYLRTRRFSEVTFRPSRHTNHWKTQHFATSLTFRACASSFYSLSRHCIFFLLTLLLFSAFSIFWLCFSALLFQLSILPEVRLLKLHSNIYMGQHA